MADVRPLRTTPPTGGRVPPHNLEAEESVLGSMMLSRTAVGDALEIVRPDDFYREVHATICSVIHDLFAQGEPSDAITVGEELRRRGALEGIGGLPYLHTLVASVPTAANAVYYARIVAELATLRRLIEASTMIAADAYEVPEDVETAVARAEELILGVATRRTGRDFQPIGEMLRETMDHMEKLASRQEDVTGVPTGFMDLDHLLSGMQPGNLILVAARPAMGKSTFAMNIAQHVAQDAHMPVVMFSLEMSSMEIAQRLICAEARVDTNKVRSGKMNEAEWRRVAHAVGRLAEAPLYIDDTPSISMGEIMAKSRRLKSREGLGLVVVDYLQLMTSPRRTENRVQEVADISRTMKIMAKQLEVPVVAVSQLSRQPEQTGGSKPRRPRLADLRECVTGDTLVCLADGSRTPIRELVGTQPRVLAIDEAGRVVEADSDLVWSVGVRPIFRVTLAGGGVIRATARHRVFAGPGWRRIDELQPGTRVATARALPEPADPIAWPDHRVALLAHLIGDGSYLRHQPLRYTTASDENSAVVRAAAEAEGARVARREGRGAWHQLVMSGNGNRWHPARVGRWLRELGIWDQRSAFKQVPAEVFRLSNRQIALFLRHLWATDGTIDLRANGSGGSVSLATASPRLAADVAALLRRLDVRARTHRVASRGSVWFHVQVSGAAEQLAFLDRVGAFGPRARPAERLREALTGVRSNPNVDTLPVEVFERVRDLMRARGITTRAMAQTRGTSFGGSSHFRFAPSRATLASYADILDDDGLRDAASSDLFWDRVVSIEPDGEEEVFDLTVPGPASWLADGIVSHNSGALEQDADVVMFVYREDYYDKETDRKGEAEIIVEKHRNGPTDTVRLAFIGEYTKFESLARV